MLMFYLLVFTAAAAGTYLIRSFALKKELLDHPNTRSSHQTPTPKGGGLAIMLVFYTALGILFFSHTVDTGLFFALLSALPIAAVSLADDIRPLSAKIRFSIQLLSTLSALYFLGGVTSLNLGLFTVEGSWLNLFALLTIIWLTNLYNFLDGIDGYAGAEAVFAGLGAYLLFHNDIALILAAASAGFLVFNWHKASIFMGDVGSAPLGFVFAILLFYDAQTPHFLAWVILLSLFWFDATLTLIRRAKQGEKLSQAHKKHAYQRLTQSGMTHAEVVSLAMGINIVIFSALYLIPETYYLYLFLLLIVLLYLLTKRIDALKAFD